MSTPARRRLMRDFKRWAKCAEWRNFPHGPGQSLDGGCEWGKLRFWSKVMMKKKEFFLDEERKKRPARLHRDLACVNIAVKRAKWRSEVLASVWRILEILRTCENIVMIHGMRSQNPHRTMMRARNCYGENENYSNTSRSATKQFNVNLWHRFAQLWVGSSPSQPDPKLMFSAVLRPALITQQLR